MFSDATADDTYRIFACPFPKQPHTYTTEYLFGDSPILPQGDYPQGDYPPFAAVNTPKPPDRDSSIQQSDANHPYTLHPIHFQLSSLTSIKEPVSPESLRLIT
jgi:hypothetical protein